MNPTNSSLQPSPDSSTVSPPTNALSRVARYTLVRAIVLFLTVVFAVYLTIFVANLGGHVDDVMRSQIEGALIGMAQGGWLRDVPLEERAEVVNRARWQMEEAAGLHEPFLSRTLRWLENGLTLNWGQSRSARVTGVGSSYSNEVRDIIMDSLPRTLLLFGLSNLLLFVSSVFLALSLVHRHGSWLDRLVASLSPLGAAPAWVYGILLEFFFLQVLHITFFTGGKFDSWPDEFKWEYVPLILKFTILPFIAIFLSGFFRTIYVWRSFFLLHSDEDYVDIGKAKGLAPRVLARRYILRPGLPNVLTSFVLILASLWQEIIILENYFNVEGAGALFARAIYSFDMPLILGLVVGFSYLLAITIFLLDIAYALVDPRVSVGNGGRDHGAVLTRKRRRFRFWRRRNPARARKSVWTVRFGLGDGSSQGIRESIREWIKLLWERVGNAWPLLRELLRYPSAVMGLCIIAVLVVISIYTVIAVPQHSDEATLYRNPLNALPSWINLFRREDLPPTIIMNTRAGEPNKHAIASKVVVPFAKGIKEITLSFPFDFTYGAFPEDFVLYLDPKYDEKKPLLTFLWLTPDGREIDLGSFTLIAPKMYRLSYDEDLERQLGTRHIIKALFTAPGTDGSAPLEGIYELRINAYVFDPEADLDVEFVLQGQVYGLAGTVGREDIMYGLLWGTPVALVLGLLAAVGTTVCAATIAALGVWFGGWVDSLLQRLIEVNMILPLLPLSILIYTLYSKNFWVLLGIFVLLSAFGSTVKNYRAIFLQVKESPYIEAARAYGASDWRIVFRYLIPRIIVVLIPQIVILIPTFIFLEATLAYLIRSSPGLPTWGQLMAAGLFGVFRGAQYLALESIGLMLLVGIAFVMVGLALERIFEPRLREV